MGGGDGGRGRRRRRRRRRGRPYREWGWRCKAVMKLRLSAH
jgi:hypothetical protein